MRIIHIFYIIIPFILWPISFLILKQYFIISMLISTTILGISTFLLCKEFIILKMNHKAFSYGFLGAFILYLIFVAGDVASEYLGLGIYIDNVYVLIRNLGDKAILSLALVWIGLMEELYWRGGLQGLLSKLIQDKSWLASSLLYMLVHIVTANPILVIASLIVGLVMAILADLYGLVAPITAHIIWLEFIIVLFPVR